MKSKTDNIIRHVYEGRGVPLKRSLVFWEQITRSLIFYCKTYKIRVSVDLVS